MSKKKAGPEREDQIRSKEAIKLVTILGEYVDILPKAEADFVTDMKLKIAAYGVDGLQCTHRQLERLIYVMILLHSI